MTAISETACKFWGSTLHHIIPGVEGVFGMSGCNETVFVSSRGLGFGPHLTRIYATPVRTIAHLFPNPRPFFTPSEGASTGDACLLGKIALAAHLGHYALRPAL
jgi:hypothetical protein